MNIDQLIEICTPLHVSNKDAAGEIRAVCIDSRKVEKGALFIAIKGNEVDGHMFIEDAIQKGASVIICEEAYYSENDLVCILEVDNSRKITGPVAQAFYGDPAEKMKVIGITGTNGKTTTATLVYQVLSRLGKKVSLLGTVSKIFLDEEEDSKLTTSDPVELAADMKRMADKGSDYMVMEVSSHALDQYRTDGIHFTVAAFTNLSHDHLDYHGSMEAYAKAKKKLFDGLSSDATAVVNRDDAYGEFMIDGCKAHVLRFGFDEGEAELLNNRTSGIQLRLNDLEIQSPLPGKFNAYNTGICYLICKALGSNEKEIAEAIAEAPGAPGRMENVLPGEGSLPDVIVDYAHTPDALKNVLETLDEIRQSGQELYVVFGAGGDRDTTKRPEMAQVAEEFADHVIVTSDNPRSENPDLIIADIVNGFSDLSKVKSIPNRREAIEEAISRARSNDIVLIAGKGHETYQEINGVRHDFDDREVAREFLTQRSGEVN